MAKKSQTKKTVEVQALIAAPPNGGTETATATDGEIQDPNLINLNLTLQAGKLYADQKAAILNTHIEQEYQQHVQERTDNFSIHVKEELSRVPKAFREGQNFVQEGESIQAKVFANTRLQVEETFNQSNVPTGLLPGTTGQQAPSPIQRPLSKGFIYLNRAQIAQYQQYIQNGEFVLPPELIERDILPQLFGGNNEQDSANDFLMNHPAVRLCVGLTRGDPGCQIDPNLPDKAKKEGPILLAPEKNVPPDFSKPRDVFGLIARQMEHVTAPEGIVNFGVEARERATTSDIGETISKLQFEKGPADTPAFFDFHKLQIAFEPLWKEVIDKSVLSIADEFYDESSSSSAGPIFLKALPGTGSGFSLTDRMVDALSKQRHVRRRVQREASASAPPIQVVMEFPEAAKVWDKMLPQEQKALVKLADAVQGKYVEADSYDPTWKNYLNDIPDADGNPPKIPFLKKDHLVDRNAIEAIEYFRQKGGKLISQVTERVEEGREAHSELERYKRAAELAELLDKKLKEPYSFTYFAADDAERAVNFGVVLTYRQKWEPVYYQAGELVRTIPLAPKEVRKYSKKTVIKKNRSEKEIEDNLRILKTDTSDTSRAEAEIVDKALNKNSFELNTTANFEVSLEIAKISGTVNNKTANEAQRESNQTKKDFREAVIKAAQEHKNERRTEITTESFYESENTESGEISNPNDELTVTYLFYELQRVFRINERLHRMRPVVLIAQEMPAPEEIDDAWIMRYDWILKRALMDDSFLYAFDCITHIRGDRLMLEELERSLLEQRKVVRDLRQNVQFYTEETGRLSRLLQVAISRQASIVEGRDAWDSIPLLGGALDSAEGAISKVGNLFGFGGDDESDPKQAAQIRRQAAQDAYERAERERRELMARVESEIGVLNGLTKQVAEKHKEINEKELLIARLKIHLKDHILHYMQTIWSYEHPDQRFFRLYNMKVPQFTALQGQYNLHIQAAPTPAAMFDEVVNLNKTGQQLKTRHAFTFSPMINVEEKTLEEVADLDNMLGFKGNYMIFPLRNSNILTDFMMAPYVDSEFGLLDPDAIGNWTLEEFDQLYCCLRDELGDRFSEVEPALKEFYKQILLDPLRPGELVPVPTDSLFIEALPGKHPIMEDFKLLHRAVDVKKVQAEVRKMEMENIRYAARILDGKNEDPDIDKKIVVQGDGKNVIVPPDN